MKKTAQVFSFFLVAGLSAHASPAKKPSDTAVRNEIPGNPENPGIPQPQNRSPSTQVEKQLGAAGVGRSPGPSVLDIRYHRDERSGKFIIDDLNPEGPFKHLKGVKETHEEPKPQF